MADSLQMLDLFSGLGGASSAMKERGWKVTTLDLEARFNPDIVADIREFSWEGGPLDLIWASPPCEAFSREFMPWCRTGKDPSMDLVTAAYRVIREADPRFWVIENTRGAVKWFNSLLGKPAWIGYPIYLWGIFPPLEKIRLKMGKEKMSSTAAAERAKIPYELSLALAKSIESAFDFRRDINEAASKSIESHCR
jgi:site-specific DNA-cytosine methylase